MPDGSWALLQKQYERYHGSQIHACNTASSQTLFRSNAATMAHEKAAAFIPRKCRLLDIGCHQGELLPWLQQRIVSGVKSIRFARMLLRPIF